MTIYTSLEDGLYTSITTVLPTARVIFAMQDAPEPATPYILINVLKLDPIGRERIGGLVVDGVVQVAQDYEAQVVLEVIGTYENTTVTGELAHQLDFLLASPLMFEALAQNNLSLMRKRVVERFPRIRETKTYMCYQQMAYFAYSVVHNQVVDTIDTVVVGGVMDNKYFDAGREGHVMTTDGIVVDPTIA